MADDAEVKEYRVTSPMQPDPEIGTMVTYGGRATLWYPDDPVDEDMFKFEMGRPIDTLIRKAVRFRFTEIVDGKPAGLHD